MAERMGEGKVRWEQMLPDELMDAIAACPVVYMAYGLAEPHGAYNALGLDWLKAHAICQRAAAAHGGVVAPPMCWHVTDRPDYPWCESRGVAQPLTSAFPPDLWLQAVLYQLRAFDARGFRAAILLTGHYGGVERDMRLGAEYYVRRTGTPMRVAGFADWEVIDHEDYRGDHAGICETSQLMALRPGLVDLARTDEQSPTGPWIGTKFPLADGRMPSAELGGKIVDSQVRRLGEVQRELLAAAGPREGWHAPTLTDVAALWARFGSLTRKFWGCSRTLTESRAGIQPPDFPGWEALGE